MESDLPPDPYLALGVPKDAQPATIKAIYRKLVLKCHPDKVQDESLKPAAADKFHQIQSAYEIIGDDDRRARYDAQCKLVELRNDVMRSSGGARGGVDVRTAAYKMPTESGRGDFYARGPERNVPVSPRYEERRPSYAQDGYFDMPRSRSRKDDEYERSSKRTPPRDEREKTKLSGKEAKENERSSRKEKSRRTDKDVRKDRDRKFAYVQVEEDTSSDSDPYERTRRRMKEEDDLRRMREKYYEEERRQKEQADSGYFYDERSAKFFSQSSAAQEYIQRSNRGPRERPESETRPAALRTSSSKDKVEYIKRADKPAVMIRRGSGFRPKSSGRDATRDERRSSVEEETNEPRETAKRPPTLNKTKSSPADIRPPFERQRSQSVQVDKEAPPIPKMKRSETMPFQSTTTSGREFRRKDSSKLRDEVNVYPTPEPSPEPPTHKFNYGGPHQYADDNEFPTPEGYRTQVREPGEPERFTRSPSPVKERERQRSTSSMYAAPQPPPLNRRTTSTTYVYGGANEGAEPQSSRPMPPSRENSSRLYGEIPTTNDRRSPRPTRAGYSPPPASVRYTQEYKAGDVRTQSKPRDVKMQTGFRQRESGERPSPSRSKSAYVR